MLYPDRSPSRRSARSAGPSHGVAMYPGAAGFSGLKLWVFEFFPFSSWLALSTQRKGKQPEERKNNAKDNFEIESQSISALDGIGVSAAIEPDGAFVDVASGEHWVCIPQERCQENVRRFGAFTRDLQNMDFGTPMV